MPWTNYHSHSHYCDGKAAPREHLEMAVARGFHAFGCSSHAPLPFKNSWGIPMDKLPAYAQEIRQLREEFAGRLQVFLGLEVDYIPGIIGPSSPWIKEAELEYSVGSVHVVDALENGYPWEIDATRQIFLQGLDEIWGNNIAAAGERYYALIRQMVAEDCPTIIGHIDKFKMHLETDDRFSEQADWYQEAVSNTLETIAAAGVMVEVNTRGIYKKKVQTTYPSPWMLEKIHRMGIPICLNSDSHAPREIDGEFTETAELLQHIGFRELMILDDQGWRPVPFSPEGLVL
jgi:histidinol-phosphatase (PHP family)